MLKEIEGSIFRLQPKEFLADVQYEIQIERRFQRADTLRSTGVIPDFSAARMHIDGVDKIDAAWNDRLTLHMSDGRKWNFFLSSDGSCTPTGGPYE